MYNLSWHVRLLPGAAAPLEAYPTEHKTLELIRTFVVRTSHRDKLLEIISQRLM